MAGLFETGVSILRKKMNNRNLARKSNGHKNNHTAKKIKLSLYKTPLFVSVPQVISAVTSAT